MVDLIAKSAPNWKRFASLTYSAEAAAVLKALCDCDPPPEGRPQSFRAFAEDGAWASVVDCGKQAPPQFAVHRAGSAWFVGTGSEVLSALKLPAGTPSGDALRQWLRWWGWVPRSVAAPPEPNDATRMVT